MKGYNQRVACIDITGEEELVMKRAVQMAVASNASLNVVHVVRPLNYFYSSEFLVDISAAQEEIQRQAEARIQQLAQQFPAKEFRHFVLVGSPKHEIHRFAKDVNADLIVIGTHGRHGVGLLLGSTANAVLHGTPCDVLVVRVDEKLD
jgi:universal stress protein A